MDPVYFKNQKEMMDWFEKNHSGEKELIAGYYKRATGRESITWPESVDAALCYGWIDGIRKSLGDEAYTIRFTPRNPNSYWSAINIRKVKELKKKGLMKPAGIAVYEKRNKDKVEKYSFERQKVEMDDKYRKIFQKNKKAWEYFNDQSPSYKKISTFWVMSAKREETRIKRFNILITCSANNEKIPLLRR